MAFQEFHAGCPRRSTFARPCAWAPKCSDLKGLTATAAASHPRWATEGGFAPDLAPRGTMRRAALLWRRSSRLAIKAGEQISLALIVASYGILQTMTVMPSGGGAIRPAEMVDSLRKAPGESRIRSCRSETTASRGTTGRVWALLSQRLGRPVQAGGRDLFSDQPPPGLANAGHRGRESPNSIPESKCEQNRLFLPKTLQCDRPALGRASPSHTEILA